MAVSTGFVMVASRAAKMVQNKVATMAVETGGRWVAMKVGWMAVVRAEQMAAMDSRTAGTKVLKKEWMMVAKTVLMEQKLAVRMDWREKTMAAMSVSE